MPVKTTISEKKKKNNKATILKCILVLHNNYYPKQIQCF